MNALAWMLAHKQMYVRVSVRPSIRPLVHTCAHASVCVCECGHVGEKEWNAKRFTIFARIMILVPLRRTHLIHECGELYFCVCRFDFAFAALLICNDAGIFVCIEYQIVALFSLWLVYEMQTICFFDHRRPRRRRRYRCGGCCCCLCSVLFIWLKRNHRSGPSLTL